MKKQFIPLLIVGSAIIAGCNQQQPAATSTVSSTPAATPTVAKADAVASVNGKFIPKSALEQLEKEIAERSHGQTFPKEKLIEELVQRELLTQDAIQKQLDKSPELLARLEDVKKSLLSQAALQEYLKANPVTDADVKAEYDKKVAAENGTEYKARHILVKTDAEAKKIIAELDKGADFAKLANKNSLDAKESQNGGDLGWFVASQMVAPFSEAVAALEKGKYTKAPVQTQFGWHVILREDSRALTPPPLEAVKDQLTPFLQRQKVQTMMEGLRKQAQVEILVPVTEEKPKAEAPAAAPAEGSAAPAAEQQTAPAETEVEATEPTEAGEAEGTAEAQKPAAEPAALVPAEPKK
jgi:peptidyl-prolyl cis-trans isomerase C